MHELFPNWMSKVSPQIDQTKLSSRWNAAKAVADAADAKMGVQLCEQALEIGTNATDILRAAARKEDSTYVTSDDALELAVLAAGAVASALSEKGSARNAIGTALITGSFGRPTTKMMTKDILQLAASALQGFAQDVRQDVSIPTWSGKMISDAAAKQVNALDFPATQVGIAEISQAVVASLKAQLQKLSEAIMRLSALQRESSDLAFLLVSGFSYVAQKPVSSMGAPEAAFCVAEDLYKITQFPSALPSFEAPIGSLLKPAKAVKKELTIATAITSVSGDLRKKCLLDSTSYPKSLPLHFALNKCEEVSGAASWTAAFGAMTGLDASLTVTPGQLAAQFYLENMLASQLGG